jgi:competence protein ComEC
LDKIKHIGPARAAEMLMLRPFTSLDDLVRIKGIAAARLADIKAEGIACVAR